jgi:dihydroxyacetone kinase-like predicted kinase
MIYGKIETKMLSQPAKQKMINSIEIHKIFCNAYNLISKEKNTINNLNVFPVPDGDTGLNMTLTLQGALNTVNEYKIKTLSVKDYLKYFSSGLTLNSRGCSGVILALFFKGIVESLYSSLKSQNFSNQEIALALRKGWKSAYQNISNPMEGTILTMMKVLADSYKQLTNTDHSNPLNTIKKIIPILEETLANTPEMLPVLKKAGVVDSGAMGFLVLIKGVAFELEYSKSLIKPLLSIANILLINKYLHSFATRKKHNEKNRLIKTILANLSSRNISNFSLANIISSFQNLIRKNDNQKIIEFIIQKSEELHESWNPNLQYRYCTEFILNTTKLNKRELSSKLHDWGDSIIVIQSGDSFKIHIHTNKPKQLLKYWTSSGEISATKIDDMKVQHKNLISEDKAFYEKDSALFFIVNGNGFAEIISGLGASEILIYKKMKPSVKQIQNALFKTRAKNIITAADDTDILPVLKSAITLYKSNIELIETRNIIQIISMMYNYLPTYDVMHNANLMRDNMNNIRYSQISRAIRDFEENEILVKKGDYFSIYQEKIIESHKTINKVILNTVSKLRSGISLVTIYSGRNEKKGNKIISELQSVFKDLDFEIYEGGQDRYDYYITFE